MDGQQERPFTPGEKKQSWGPAIGLIIILILIIAGGFYFFSRDNSGPSGTDIPEFQEVSSSDELADIEADLANTELEGLDAELELITEEQSELETKL